jgi:hypothetical protein
VARLVILEAVVRVAVLLLTVQTVLLAAEVAEVVQGVVSPVAAVVTILAMLVAEEAALGYWGQALREMEVLSVLQRELGVRVVAGVILAALLLTQVAQELVGSGVMVVLLAVAAGQVGAGLAAAAPLLGEEEVMAAAVRFV